jgi:hypothetical protein
LIEPLNITNNTNWRTDRSGYSPFQFPHLVALNNNLFVLIWVDQRTLSTGDLSDVWFAIIDDQGNQVKPPSKLTSGVAGVQGYQDPMSIVLQNNKALITYVDDVSKQIFITALDSDGSVVFPQTALAGQ